jgi:membrane-associated phospholipid phosphatase
MLAGLCVVGLVLVWVIANLVPAAHWRDAIVLHDFTQLGVGRPLVIEVTSFLLHLLDPLQFILWGVALMAVALARERPRVALAVLAIMSLAPWTAEMLKPLVAHPHEQLYGNFIGAASWPSGHATAALALVLCAVLVAPSRMRPLVAALGAAYALAVGCSLLILAWHMPSDVLGGYLLASLWASIALAALRASERRWPPRHPL